MMILGETKTFLTNRNEINTRYDPIQQMWDRDRKTARDNFGRKRK